MEMVTSLVEGRALVIFSKRTCCLSYSMQQLMSSYGAHPTVHELDNMSNGQQIENALKELGCEPTTPAVFIGERFIGGSKEVLSLQVKNQLERLLIDAGAIWV